MSRRPKPPATRASVEPEAGIPPARSDAAPEAGETSRLDYLAAVVSWTFAIAMARKRSLRDAARRRVIVQMNTFYLVTSTLILAAIVTLSGNSLASTQWGPSDAGCAFRVITFIVASYCLSRCIEVSYAFIRDAFDKLARRSAGSDLRGPRRIGLALASYGETIINFTILLSLAPSGEWQDVNANPPTKVTDVLFYSASSITTSGGGGFIPKGVIVQALTAFEIACGLILLVVCFAVYAGHKEEDRR